MKPITLGVITIILFALILSTALIVKKIRSNDLLETVDCLSLVNIDNMNESCRRYNQNFFNVTNEKSFCVLYCKQENPFLVVERERHRIGG